MAILREKFQLCIPSHRENAVKYNRTQPIEQTVTLAKNSSTSERVAKMKLWLSWLNPDESVTVSKREQSEMTLHGISDMKFSFTGDKTGMRIGYLEMPCTNICILSINLFFYRYSVTHLKKCHSSLSSHCQRPSYRRYSPGYENSCL